MPNIRSAKKRVRVSAAKTLRNKSAKSALKTVLKKTEIAVTEGNGTAAYVSAQKAIDKAVAKGLLHKNTAARRKSRLVRSLNAQ